MISCFFWFWFSYDKLMYFIDWFDVACWWCACICIVLVKLIPIVWNLTCIAVNRYPGDDGWLGWIRVRVLWTNRWLLRLDSCPSVMDESMVTVSECDGSVMVTWSRVGTICIVSAFMFAWNCNMLGCLPVLQFFGWLLICAIWLVWLKLCVESGFMLKWVK